MCIRAGFSFGAALVQVPQRAQAAYVHASVTRAVPEGKRMSLGTAMPQAEPVHLVKLGSACLHLFPADASDWWFQPRVRDRSSIPQRGNRSHAQP
jgi:hypothetical protein